MLRCPEAGGDTIFTSQTALYDKLSPIFQHLCDSLTALHSSEASFINSINGGYKPFRGPVRRAHPLVRVHPVTKLKSLYYNPVFVIHLPELKAQESTHTLSFLREHLHAADDLTVRWHWEPNSVAMWDNRVVVHRAIPGGYDPASREGKRTAIFGEVPISVRSGDGSETLTERVRRLGGEDAKFEETKLYFNSPQV
jgi:sulfonate dioxygenase